MSKHSAMILCEHKKVICPTCDTIIKQIKSILSEVDTRHGRLTRIAANLGMKEKGEAFWQ